MSLVCIFFFPFYIIAIFKSLVIFLCLFQQRAALVCATAMGDAHWTKMADTVSASQDGGEQGVT